MGGPTDHRAWDATVAGPGWLLGVEAETRVRDLQALLRRIELKLRDGRVDGLLLVLSDTEHHRRLLRDEGATLRAQLPGSARRTLGALRAGQRPADRTVVLL